MKIQPLLLTLILSSAVCGGFPEETRKLYRDELVRTSRAPDAESILASGMKLSGIGRHTDPDNPSEFAFYQEFQRGVMTIPGSVDHLTESVENERKRAESLPPGGGGRASYEDRRMKVLLHVLPGLPFPDSIKALGNYLHDERDVPPPARPGQDWSDLPANSYLASDALNRIGLVDGPRHSLEAQKQWWERVKAGKEWFAFHGQDVSYRFKDDTTVETRPRDASKDARWIPRTDHFNLAPEPDESEAVRHWRLWAGGAIVGGGALFLIRRKRLTTQAGAGAAP